MLQGDGGVTRSTVAPSRLVDSRLPSLKGGPENGGALMLRSPFQGGRKRSAAMLQGDGGVTPDPCLTLPARCARPPSREGLKQGRRPHRLSRSQRTVRSNLRSPAFFSG